MIKIDVYHHIESEKQILYLLRKISGKVEDMSKELDALTLEVQENADVIDSAIVLIEGIAEQLEAIKDDPAKIQALADELNVTSDRLAAAVAAHTEVEPV